MLGKILAPLTTATPAGVATRDVVQLVGAVLAVLGVLGFLSPEQIKALTEQAPIIITAAGTLIWSGMAVYRAVAKSSSDRAAEVARAVDAKIPASAPVRIETPPGLPDIYVPGK